MKMIEVKNLTRQFGEAITLFLPLKGTAAQEKVLL